MNCILGVQLKELVRVRYAEPGNFRTRVAARLVGNNYLSQNTNATHGVSAVLAIDGGSQHLPLNTHPAFAVRVVGDRGRTGLHCHFQGVLNVVLAGQKTWSFVYPDDEK